VVERPEVLGIIQARGGSKGLPRKNVRLLRGHPLVSYSIASGLSAKSITRLIVSTDDDEIAEIGRRYGAEVPFRRPTELAGDDTPDIPLFVHALNWLEGHEDYRPDAIVQLRPTTPFRPCGMIDEAVRLLWVDPKADCIRGVTTPKQTPYKMWRDSGDGYLLPLMDTPFAEPYNMPRQKLPATYWQTGHIDVIRTTTIREQGSLTGRHVKPIHVELSYCVDIDSPADFELAEQIIDQKKLDIDLPRPVDGISQRRHWPDRIDLVVFDFDGVLTDNRVLVSDDGGEAVLCDRGDGMGISLLRQRGVEMIVLSTETHPVVEARCRKLALTCRQGLADKAAALAAIIEERRIAAERVVYLGNDVNDLGCMQLVGFSVAVADAHPIVLQQADLVLSRQGGRGAVREFCDRVLNTRNDIHGEIS
jgi:YrbI family 3-deoxy-D-manno-octulosonate 8-phosphate phosphatase